LTLNDIWSSLDLDRIYNAIVTNDANERSLTDFQVKDVKSMLLTATERWLLRDLSEFYDVKLEKLTEIPFVEMDPLNPPVTFPRAKGYVDIVTHRYKKDVPQRIIIDWKTTSRKTLDAEWKDRLAQSWQGRFYLFSETADEMHFRGVKYDGVTAEVILPWRSSYEWEVPLQLEGIWAQIQALKPFPVYPRSMPKACGAFGRECPRLMDCKLGTMPQGVPRHRDLSYSTVEKFLLCPERFRRDNLEEDGKEGGSEESSTGSGFHRGIAEIYRQVFKL
jgi:hypothetical protein